MTQVGETPEGQAIFRSVLGDEHIVTPHSYHLHRPALADISEANDYRTPSLDTILTDGLHSLQSSAGVDIAEVKREHGDRLCLMGNMDLDQLLPFGTPQQVREQARRLCEHIGADGGHILSTCNILTDAVPIENVRAMYENACRKEQS